LLFSNLFVTCIIVKQLPTNFLNRFMKQLTYEETLKQAIENIKRSIKNIEEAQEALNKQKYFCVYEQKEKLLINTQPN
jgi:hypothetical protein